MDTYQFTTNILKETIDDHIENLMTDQENLLQDTRQGTKEYKDRLRLLEFLSDLSALTVLNKE